MKRGYVTGKRRIGKVNLLKEVGVTETNAIYQDSIPSKTGAAQSLKPYPKRKTCIRALQPGDSLYVTDLCDLGPAAIDIMQAIGQICERGAKLHIITEEKDKPRTEEIIEFSNITDAALVTKVAKMAADASRSRQGRIMKDARMEKKVRTGPRGRFDTDLKPYVDDIYKIWGTIGITRHEAGERVNQFLVERSLTGISVELLQKRFGNKTDAEKEFLSK